MTTITAKYAGRCARTGAQIRPGDRVEFDPATRTVSLTSPDFSLANRVDEYMPRHGLGRTRAQVWRPAINARYGAHLDHEVE